MTTSWDVIVVGARCAGSPTAMLLARKGYRVLVVDKATFPSDVISTLVIHPHGVECLERWGLLDQVVDSGCPPIHTYVFDFGALTIAGSPGTAGSPVAYAPRRFVLDEVLVRAAAAAGAEVREGAIVEDVVIEDGRVVGITGHRKTGGSFTERAAIVIGADGRYSRVADAVSAATYHEKPTVLASYYSYWSNLPMDGRFETYVRPNRGFAALPTHDDRTLVIAGWPYAEFEANKRDLEASYRRVFELAPSFAERLRGAKQEDRLFGATVPNFFRKPYGPGWVLVGDAGYIKDPITAQGITDAFHDAERCAAALDLALSGTSSFEDAFADYQRDRDDYALPRFDMTWQIATLAPPPAELQQVLAAIHGNQAAMDAFVRLNAGIMSPAEFFAPEHLGPIMAAAQAGSTRGAPAAPVHAR